MFDKHSPTVIADPAAPASERYRMMAWEWRQARRGYCVAHSPDGIDWTEYPVNPVLGAGDEILETVTVARAPDGGEYFAFYRRWDRDRFQHRLIAVGHQPRLSATRASTPCTAVPCGPSNA